MSITNRKNGQDSWPGMRHDKCMDRPNSRRNDILFSVAEWIERHLEAPLTLDQIAGQAGLSPYHFSRLFTARMGRSVMAYVRGRRLINAARRLVDDPAVRLVDLAFDSGFDSPEAFARAFRRIFGVAPSRFRQGFAVISIEGEYSMTVPNSVSTSVVKLPDLVARGAFAVAGRSRRFDEATKADIPQLWSQLMGALPFEGQAPNWATYGVVWGADRAEGSFDYMAGVEIKAGTRLPDGFATKEIPSATYAVFRITLDGSALHPQIKAAMATIWGDLIPAAGLNVADSPDFERYDGKFELHKPGAVIDFYVPVEI